MQKIKSLRSLKDSHLFEIGLEFMKTDSKTKILQKDVVVMAQFWVSVTLLHRMVGKANRCFLPHIYAESDKRVVLNVRLYCLNTLHQAT